MSNDMNFELAPGWRPAEGDVIVGKVTDLARQRSNVNEQAYYPIITVTVESPVTVAAGENETRTAETGESVAVHCFHGVLKARIIELRPEVGDRLGIKFLSQTVRDKNAKGGNTPNVYVVKVEGKQVDIYSGMTHPYEDAPTVNTQDESKPVNSQETVSDLEDDDIPF